jgi:hypothetical protein
VFRRSRRCCTIWQKIARLVILWLHGGYRSCRSEYHSLEELLCSFSRWIGYLYRSERLK